MLQYIGNRAADMADTPGGPFQMPPHKPNLLQERMIGAGMRALTGQNPYAEDPLARQWRQKAASASIPELRRLVAEARAFRTKSPAHEDYHRIMATELARRTAPQDQDFAAADSLVALREVRKAMADIQHDFSAVGAIDRLRRTHKTMKAVAKTNARKWLAVRDSAGDCFTAIGESLECCDQNGRNWGSCDTFAFIEADPVREIRQRASRGPGTVFLQRLDRRRLAMNVSDHRGRRLDRLSRIFPLLDQPRRGVHVIRFNGFDFQDISRGAITNVIGDW